MAKAEMTVHVADLPEVKRYMRELEDAALTLWDWLPIDQAKELREWMPRLAEFMAHLHHSIEHEQAMVRQNVWAEEEPQPNERALPRRLDRGLTTPNAAPTEGRSDG